MSPQVQERRHLTVVTRPRQVRVAYLIDAESTPTFLETLAVQHQRIIFPHAATCTRSVCEPIGEAYGTSDYRLFIGESLADWLAFWNDIFTISPYSRANWRALCLPASAVQDSEFVETLSNFLRKFAHRNGQHSPNIKWTATSLSVEELRSLASPYMGRRIDAHFQFERQESWHFPGVRIREKPFFGFSGGGFGQPVTRTGL